MKFLALIAALTSLLLLSGCNHDSDTVTNAPRTESALPNGWKEIATSGISVAFPPDWKAIDLSQGDMKKGGDAMLGSDPAMAPMRAQIEQLARSGVFKVFVFDTSKLGSGFGTNCNVAVMQQPPSATLEAEVDATKAQAGPMLAPGTEIEVAYVDVPAGKAARLLSQLKTADATKPPLTSLSYMLLRNGNMYNVTFTCSKAETESIKDIAEKSMKTFKFTD